MSNFNEKKQFLKNLINYRNYILAPLIILIAFILYYKDFDLVSSIFVVVMLGITICLLQMKIKKTIDEMK